MSNVTEEDLDRYLQDVPCKDSHETGSRFICNPPVMDTDEDWILDCSEGKKFDEAADYLRDNGFSQKDMREDDYDDICENFSSFRKGYINFILCNKREFYNKFVLATLISKELNLLKKFDRITLFQAILYGIHDGEKVAA